MLKLKMEVDKFMNSNKEAERRDKNEYNQERKQSSEEFINSKNRRTIHSTSKKALTKKES